MGALLVSFSPLVICILLLISRSRIAIVALAVIIIVEGVTVGVMYVSNVAVALYVAIACATSCRKHRLSIVSPSYLGLDAGPGKIVRSTNLAPAGRI